MCVFEHKGARDEIGIDNLDFEINLNSKTTKSGDVGPPEIIEMSNEPRVLIEPTLDELKKLCALKGAEAVSKLNTSYGGAESLAKSLNTSVQSGLDEANKEDLKRRVDKFGQNEIPTVKSKSFFALALHAFKDPTLIMLTLCALISIGLSFYRTDDEVDKGGLDHSTNTTTSFMNTTVQSTTAAYTSNESSIQWIEGVSIMIAVLVVVFVTAFNDWRKEKQFRGLRDCIEDQRTTSVIRNGTIKQLNIRELLVGDICLIKYGDLIPADGVIVQASDLNIDESSLTGETHLIKKDTTNDVMVLSGSSVMEGSAQFLVLAVGLNSQTGIIMKLMGAAKNDEPEDDDDDFDKVSVKSKLLSRTFRKKKLLKKSGKDKEKKKSGKSVLQKKLGRLAIQIGYIGISSSLLTFVILVVRMAIIEFAIKKNHWSNAYIKFIFSYLIQAITVIVVAVPEGLPLAVTIALAYAVKQMTKYNNLVRHLDACETMGNATTICSDKTGTLTTNRMTAVKCWIGDNIYEPVKNSQIEEKHKALIFESISINSNYTSMIENGEKPGELPKQLGNKTECALLGFVQELGGSYPQIRSQNPQEGFVKVYTFNSARKMMGTVIKVDNDTKWRLHAKGASEVVLRKCTSYLSSDGSIQPLSEERVERLVSEVVEPMAGEGLRTICVACRDLDVGVDLEDEDASMSQLTCLALIGIEDPVRPEVPDSIKKCQEAGVIVRMVTGDNVSTARSIAIKCGIIAPGDDFLVIESREFNEAVNLNGKFNQEKFDQLFPKLRVLARSSPQDKYVLVKGIVESKASKIRDVVAVTGDGTNDGPALKMADVGFAMGIQGTHVAKEASDIILTDDNFSSIVTAMLWGRNVYDAITKFLQFQLTANFTALIFSIVCAAAIQAIPLKAVQMLWVNLVMDTLASLALATEPPTDELLKRKPYGRDKSLISITIMKNITGHVLYQLLISFILVFKITDIMGVPSVINGDMNTIRAPSSHFSIVFNAFVQMTLFNEINARKIRNERNVFAGIHRNLYFIVIWIFCFIGQVIIVTFGGIVFEVVSLSIAQWAWCVAFGVGSLIWQQLIITIPDSVFKKFIIQPLDRVFSLCRIRKNKSKSKSSEKSEKTSKSKKSEKSLDVI